VKGYVDIVRTLLECGAYVEVQNNVADTALMRASRYGYVEIVHTVLEYGADVGVKNNDGETALHEAVRYGQLEIVADPFVTANDILKTTGEIRTLIKERGPLLNCLGGCQVPDKMNLLMKSSIATSNMQWIAQS